MFTIPQFLLGTPLINSACIGIWKAYARHLQHKYSVEKRLGLLFLVDRENAVDRHLLLRGRWEQEQIDLLTSMARGAITDGRRLVFLDIGSHGALYSMLMVREGIFDDVIALEPHPENLAQLNSNLLLNNMLAKVRVFDVAASDKAGETVFNVAIDANRGGSRIDDEGDIAVSHQIKVRTARLDDLVDTSGAVLVVKIDVEGHELQVLAGMPTLLSKNACIMQIESTKPETLAQVKALLAEHGIRHTRSICDDHFFIDGR